MEAAIDFFKSKLMQSRYFAMIGIMLMDSKQDEMSSIKKLLVIGKKIYQNAPAYLHFIFLPFEKIFWLISVLRLDLWHIKGNEISSQKEIETTYAGIEENKNLLIKVLYDSSYKEKYIGKFWLWKIRKTINNNGYNCSLMITELPKTFQKFFKKNKGFFLPSWIFAGLDISEDFDCIISKSRCFKSDRQKVKKKNLSYEISTDPQQYYNFYHQMYVPHITNAYGDCASLLSYDFMERQFSRCDS